VISHDESVTARLATHGNGGILLKSDVDALLGEFDEALREKLLAIMSRFVRVLL
jgi:hypothetical protein